MFKYASCFDMQIKEMLLIFSNIIQVQLDPFFYLSLINFAKNIFIKNHLDRKRLKFLFVMSSVIIHQII